MKVEDKTYKPALKTQLGVTTTTEWKWELQLLMENIWDFDNQPPNTGWPNLFQGSIPCGGLRLFPLFALATKQLTSFYLRKRFLFSKVTFSFLFSS